MLTGITEFCPGAEIDLSQHLCHLHSLGYITYKDLTKGVFQMAYFGGKYFVHTENYVKMQRTFCARKAV